MKNKKNILFLVENGLSSKVIGKMTDNQVKVLVEKFKKESNEQVTQVTEPQKTSFNIKGPGELPNNPTGKGYEVKKNTDGSVTATPMENEIKEDENWRNSRFETGFGYIFTRWLSTWDTDNVVSVDIPNSDVFPLASVAVATISRKSLTLKPLGRFMVTVLLPGVA